MRRRDKTKKLKLSGRHNKMTFRPPKKDKGNLARLDIGIIIVICLMGLLLRLISFNLSIYHDVDVNRYIRRSTLVLRGRISYRNFSDPKPVWTYTLAAWFFLFGIKVENLFVPQYGSIILELSETVELKEDLEGVSYKLLGFTQGKEEIKIKDLVMKLDT